MARPKRSEADAYERIIAAFWDMLAEMPYSKVTLTGLSQKAGVNHNLIYYYFENMDDLAEKLFQKNLESGEPQQMIRQMLTGNVNAGKILDSDEKALLFKRMRLFMRNDSAFLNGIARNAILAEWLKSSGRDMEQLTVAERIDMQFVIGGFMSILGNPDNELSMLTGLPERALGEGIRKTILRLKAADGKNY